MSDQLPHHKGERQGGNSAEFANIAAQRLSTVRLATELVGRIQLAESPVVSPVGQSIQQVRNLYPRYPLIANTETSPPQQTVDTPALDSVDVVKAATGIVKQADQALVVAEAQALVNSAHDASVTTGAGR